MFCFLLNVTGNQRRVSSVFERSLGATVGSIRGRVQRRGGDGLRIQVQGSVQEMTGPWRCRDKDRSEECFESGISRTVLGSGLPLMSKGTRV